MRKFLVFSSIMAALAIGPSAFAITDFYSTGPGAGSPDTLDDVWQSLFNGWGLDPNADTDGDGCSNFVEMLAGTNPRLAGDCLKVGNMSISAGNVVFTFKAEAGKKYRILASNSPAYNTPAQQAAWTAQTIVFPSGLPVFTEYVPSADNAAQNMSVAQSGTSKFYKLEVSDADSDSDGVSDWAEKKLGTNPAVASSTGNGASDGDTIHSLLTLTAATTVANGYERDDKTLSTPAVVPAKIGLTRTFGTMALSGITMTGSAGTTDPTKTNASAGDYSLSTVNIPAGAGVPGAPYEVNVTPVQDSIDEVPEYLKITFNHPLTANLTAGANATVCICDAPSSNPNNNTLYVAFLGHENGEVTTGSGYATAIVNGDNTSASVSLTFSNLSSTQNTAYIRNTSGGHVTNNDLAPALPNGQFAGTSYAITNKGSFFTSDQAFLTGLNSGGVGIAVTTANYPSKEIYGIFNKATGSTTFDPGRADLVQPSLPGTMTPTEVKRDIYRFLDQCTFGATTALYLEINALVTAQGDAGGEATSGTTSSAHLLVAYTQWLDKQMDLAQTPSPNFVQLVQAADNEEFVMRGLKPIWAGNDPQYAGQSYGASYDSQGMLTNPMNTTGNTTYNNNHPFWNNRRREWWTMILQSKDQVRQRMAAALHEIVVISENDATVQSAHYGCANYWDMMAQGAFGKYRTLLENVTYNPLMGIYLSSLRNRARYISGGVEIFPDENYAREIMQLFSIGLVQRHPDGGLILDGDGLLMPTYDQTDITEMARVMTGLCMGARHATATVMRFSTNGNTMAPSGVRVSPQIEIQGVNFTNFGEGGNEGWWQAGWIYPMKILGRASGVTYHDFNKYVAPDNSVSNTVSKVLFAGKRGEVQLPYVDISGMSDVATHAAAENEMRLALNALAGDPTSGGYSGHPNTPVNISRWLIQRLTTSNPSPGYIYRVEQVYESSNGNLGNVLKAILLDYEARSLTLADSRPGTGRVKEPMMHYAAMMRSLKVSSNAPLANLNQMALNFSITDSMNNQPYPTSELNKFPAGASRIRFNDLTSAIGQSPQKAPSVFNWFLPDYVPPGNLAAAGLFAPELQIDNETNLVSRVNRIYNTFPGYTVTQTTTGSFPGYTGVDDFTANAANSAPELLTDVATLTFDSSNWSTPQTVTVTGYDDFDPEGAHQSMIWHQAVSTDTNFNNITSAPTIFTINDNESSTGKLVSIVQSGGSTAVTEGAGGTDTYTVVLTSPPSSGTVTVTPEARSPYFTTSAPAVIGDVTFSPASVTFDTSNWNTPQTITVTANDDAIVNGYLVGGTGLSVRTAMIRNNVTASADATYNNLLVSDIACPITDNDGTTRLVITENSVTGTTGANGVSVVTEGSTTDTFTVALAQGVAPTANVTVTLAWDDTRMHLSATGLSAVTNANTTSATATLTFAAATYTTGVTVTITAVDDAIRQGVQFYPITFTTTCADTNYAGLESKWPGGTAQLQVRVNDNDSDTVNGFTWIPYGGSNNVRAVEGGMTAQYLVCLNKAPTGDVTATWIGSSGDVAGIGSPVFTTTNWWVPQTVTVSGNNDTFPEPTRVSPIRYTFSGGGYDSTASNPPAFNFTCIIGDDDLNSSAAVAISKTAVAVIEGGATDSFTLTLSGEPNSNVVFSFSSLPSNQVTVSPSTVTFTPGNWSTPQTVTITAVDNAINDGARIVALSTVCSSTDSRYNNSPVPDVAVTVTDNDSAVGGIILSHAGGDTTIMEGGATDTINVALAGPAPSANVTVSLVNTMQFTFSPITLTFTPGNYTTPQAVTVTAVDDTLPEPITTDVMTATTDAAQPAGYTSLSATLPVVELDNDDTNNSAPATPGVQIIESNGANTRVVEGGMTDTIEVALRRAPTADVTLTATFGSPGQVTVDKPTLTFNASNWNIPQTVAITAIDDTIQEGAHSTTVIYTANVAGGYTASDTANVTCRIGDNEASKPGVILQDSAGTVQTGPLVISSLNQGSTFQYKIALAASPGPSATSVTVTPTCFINQINGVSSSGLTFSPTSVTFTSANFATAQTITVTAANALLPRSTQAFTIQNATTVTGTDINYNTMVANDVLVTVNASTANRINVAETGGSTVITEDSGTDTIAVSLSGASAPASNVTVNVTTSTAVRTLLTTGSAPATTVALTFTPANYNVPQNVTIVPVSDALSQGVVTDTITLSTPSTGPTGWTSLSETQTIRVLDNDDIITQAIQIVQSNTNTRVIEGGQTDTFEVYLRRQPTGTVTLTPAFTNASQVTLSPSTLTFNANTWATPQTVTVTAVNDGVNEGVHSTNLTYSASGGGYLSSDVSAALTISIGDNVVNPAAILAAGTGTTLNGNGTLNGSITENGSSITYTVKLSVAPASGATVRVTPAAFLNNALDASTQFTFSPTSVSFTSANFSTAQTITVAPVNNAVAEPTYNLSVQHTCTVTAGTDARYVNLVGPDAAITVLDDDTGVGRLVGTTNQQLFNYPYVVVAEDAGTDTLQISLAGPAPAVGSPISVSVARAGSQVQFAFADGSTSTAAQTLTFTDTNYNVPQTLTIMSATDATAEGVHSDTINITTNASQPAPYTSLTTAIPVRIIDNDDQARTLINIYQTGGTTKVVEGGISDTYSVVLRRAPTANVTLTPSYNPSQITLSATALTFTPSNWNTPQTITVTAVDDADIESVHTSVINYTASSTGGYLITDTASVTVTIGDNDVKAGALITVTQSGGFTALGENSTATDTYTLVLGSQPSGNVVITPQVYNPLVASNPISFSPTSITFTPANWSTPQTVTLTLANDAANNSNRFVFVGHRISSTDLNYATYNVPGFPVILGDDDETTNGIYVLNTGGSTIMYEGGTGGTNSDTVYVMLRKKPTGAVTVTPSLSTASQVTFSPTTLSFDTTNWNIPQILTLTAVNDATTEGNPATYTLTCTPSATGGYTAANTGTLTGVSIYDAQSKLVITPASTSVSEGGTTTYTVALNGAPTAPVTVTIVTQKHARQNGYLAQQFGYFATDVGTGTNQQKDNLFFDWSELTTLYTSTYTATRGAATESTSNAPAGHLAATKAVIDLLDLWWCGGRLKAKWPDGTPQTTPPTNPRQPIIDAIYNAYSTTRLSTDTTNFPIEVRDRCRFAAYLVGISPAGITAH